MASMGSGNGEKPQIQGAASGGGASPGGSDQANIVLKKDEYLEKVLLDQGYTDDEIHRDGNALIGKVRQLNNLSKIDDIKGSINLTVPPSQVKLKELSETREHEGIISRKADDSVTRQLPDGSVITKKSDGSIFREYDRDGARVSTALYPQPEAVYR